MLGAYIEKQYKKRAFVRYDGNPAVKYFTYADFPPMKKEDQVFTNKRGTTLAGAFYYNDNKNTESVVVFEHGMGAGHEAYMREIATLTQHGYTVFAYDHEGCMASGGDSVKGFGGSITDLDAAITRLKELGYQGKNISVIGHSWGGYSTLNIPAFHSDLNACIAMSCYISVESIVNQYLSGIAKISRERIMKLEKEANPDSYWLDARSTLKNTTVRMLIIHSEDDKTVSYKGNFEKLRSSLVENDNVSYIRVTGKGHNPNYTKDAVKLLGKMNDSLHKKRKKLCREDAVKEFRESWDFLAMTEQDMDIWKSIFEHLTPTESSDPAEQLEDIISVEESN